MTSPHMHKDLIIAWANGAIIQLNMGGVWVTDPKPQWSADREYRIKQEPKPDVVVYQTVKMRPDRQRVISYIETKERFCTDNVMFVFDGETGALKDAQVLAHE